MILVPTLPRLSISVIFAACMAAAISLADPAIAADNTKTTPAARPGSKPAAAAPYVPKRIEPLLTREQLRGCMALQKSNKELATEVTRLQTEVKTETEVVKRDGEALKADLATLDRSNEEAVKAYNQRTAERNRQVVDFEAKVADFNGKVQAFDQGRASYARDCENRKFDEKDEKALLKGS